MRRCRQSGQMIRIPLNAVLYGAAVLVVVWIVWLMLLWSPARQVELHTLNLLERASKQRWEEVGTMMASDYRDAWGHGKEQALTDAEEFGRHFFSLRIGPFEPMAMRKEKDSIHVAARLGIYGSGTPMAHAIIEAVHELQEPFVFRWRKDGSWPWQWALAELEQDELVARYPR